MEYCEWNREMRRIQIAMGKPFEEVLLHHFQQFGDEVIPEPVLPGGKKPDFLITDTESRSCYVEAKVLLSPRELDQYKSLTKPRGLYQMEIKEHTRNRLQEKLQNEIDEKYTAEELGGIPLILAFLDVSSEDIVDMEGEAYGTTSLNINTREVSNSGHGIWGNGQELYKERRHIHGVWKWICWPECHQAEGLIEKPVLATNPWEDVNLPNSIKAFYYRAWKPHPHTEGKLIGEIEDGGASYDPQDIRERCKVNEYIEKSRELAQRVRNEA